MINILKGFIEELEKNATANLPALIKPITSALAIPTIKPLTKPIVNTVTRPIINTTSKQQPGNWFQRHPKLTTAGVIAGTAGAGFVAGRASAPDNNRR